MRFHIKKCFKYFNTHYVGPYTMVIVATLLFLYVKFVIFTSKVKFIIPNNLSSKKHEPLIFCFWHGRLLSAIFARKFVPKATVLLSRARDGNLAAILMKMFKVDMIRGSTSRNNVDKGGASSLKQMIKVLTINKEVIAIAPDGPIGPRMRVTPGVALLSLVTNVPIVPITMSSKRNILFKTWDKFMLPLPFNKIKIKFGDLIYPNNNQLRKSNLEEYRKQIEHDMVKLTQDLDKEMKQPIINPSDVDKNNQLLKRRIK